MEAFTVIVLLHFSDSVNTVLLYVIQVLKGDIRPAIETHEMLYQVTKKHNFLPEVICLLCVLKYYLH